MRSATELATLERVGYDLWIAAETEELDGWRLRFAHGLTKRGNSVWPNGDGGARTREEKLDAVERWYAERGAPAMFQVSPAAQPATLEAAPRERGYENVGTPASVETARVEPITLLAAGANVRLGEDLDDGWTAVCAASRGFERLDVARSLLSGSPGRTASCASAT
jgi:hypothetical protein